MIDPDQSLWYPFKGRLLSRSQVRYNFNLVPHPSLMKHLDELGIEKLSTASPIPLIMSDPTPGAQPLSSNVVNITQAAAVGPWFRFQPNSNSEM